MKQKLLAIDDTKILRVLHLLQPMWPDLLLAAKLSSDQDFEQGLQVWLLNFATVFLMMELEREEGVGKVLGV